MNVKAAVTGGAGFIGHHLVSGLLARGHEVRVIDDFSTGLRSRLAPAIHRIALTEGSILDRSALDEAFAGCEVVFHEAAVASVARSIEAPRETNDVNVGGTIEVMLAAARNGVRRVVFAGSSAVYGTPKMLPCREAQRVVPVSPYGASKLAAEHFLHTLGVSRGVQTVALRYFNVFGPGQDPASEYSAVVPRFITAVLEGRIPVINGSGLISRDYIYVDNVIDANMLASGEVPSGMTCNIASGDRHSLLELLGIIGSAAGRRVSPQFGPPRAGDIEHSQADITIAREALAYRVRVPFAEGIARTVAWYREHLVC